MFARYRGNVPTIASRTLNLTPAFSVYNALCRLLGLAVIVSAMVLAGRSVVPAYLAAHRQAIQASAQRHGLPVDVLAAVLYNEMLGEEHRFLSALIPGDTPVAQTIREGLLGWHFLTLKQAQWTMKSLAALAGANTTVGPTGIRVSVGREIHSEVAVAGGRYQPSGWAERPSMVRDLMAPTTAIEYLAANLERGQRRAAPAQEKDWTILARWHNTGLTSDRPDVPRRVWDKGTRYVARVQAFLPHVAPMVYRPTLPRTKTAIGDAALVLSAHISGSAALVRPQ